MDKDVFGFCTVKSDIRDIDKSEFDEGKMKKYIKLFLKRRLLIVFISSTVLFILFFFVLSFCKSAVYPPSFALWVYVLAMVWYGFYIILALRFKALIKRQEKQFGIIFNDTNVMALYPKSDTFLSDDWLIFAGKTAFYRQYISFMQVILKQTNMGDDYYLKIQAVDGKIFSIHIDSNSSAQKIKKWYDCK